MSTINNPLGIRKQFVSNNNYNDEWVLKSGNEHSFNVVTVDNEGLL